MRYLSHSEEQIAQILKSLGLESVDQLFDSIPGRLRMTGPLALPEGLDEASLLKKLRAMAAENRDPDTVRNFTGAGLYNHYSPTAINELLLRPEFYTAYTPYQPEVSQGTLQAMFEYQTMICRLLGTQVSNASMYDGSTAFAEACLMAQRIARGKRRRVLLVGAIHPEYVAVLRSYMKEFDELVTLIPEGPDGAVDIHGLEPLLTEDVAAVAVQSPNFFGIIEDLGAIAALVKDKGIKLVANFTEALAFGVLLPPAAAGADIVCGEGQSLGIAMNLGGPGLGILATSKDNVRAMPGRLVGKTVDRRGEEGYVVTISTREQHIRRERATSNICTNEGLCALNAAMYMTLMGPQGLKVAASASHTSAVALKKALLAVPGVSDPHPDTAFFNEFVLSTTRPAAEVLEALAVRGIAGGVDLGCFFPERANQILMTTTELTMPEDIIAYAGVLAQILA